MDLSKGLTLSVVIPVYNGGQSFHECLSTLTAAVPSADEIIVVADGGTDNSHQVAQEFGVQALRLPENGGPAKARNLGAKQAKGDILFFVDADVAIYPDAIEQVKNAFEADPNLAALIGSYDDAPGDSGFLSQYKNLFHHYTHQTAREEASTFWGACGAIRRQIFLDIGGFDESYRRPCVEDIELGYRLKSAGYKIRLDKDIQVKHLKRWELLSLLKAEFFYRALPWTALIVRDRTLINDLNLGWTSRLSVVLTYTLLLTLVLSVRSSQSLVLAGAVLLVLLLLNLRVYHFFYNKRGLLFTLKTIPWHWLYYFYSGLAFAIGHVRHWLQPQSASYVSSATSK